MVVFFNFLTLADLSKKKYQYKLSEQSVSIMNYEILIKKLSNNFFLNKLTTNNIKDSVIILKHLFSVLGKSICLLVTQEITFSNTIATTLKKINIKDASYGNCTGFRPIIIDEKLLTSISNANNAVVDEKSDDVSNLTINEITLLEREKLSSFKHINKTTGYGFAILKEIQNKYGLCEDMETKANPTLCMITGLCGVLCDITSSLCDNKQTQYCMNKTKIVEIDKIIGIIPQIYTTIFEVLCTSDIDYEDNWKPNDNVNKSFQAQFTKFGIKCKDMKQMISYEIIGSFRYILKTIHMHESITQEQIAKFIMNQNDLFMKKKTACKCAHTLFEKII